MSEDDKQVIIGTYELGWQNVQLVLRSGTGGNFYMLPGDIKEPRIKVGADYDKFWQVIACLLHEAEELAMAIRMCRYTPEDDVMGDIHAYTFFMTHSQFHDVQAATGYYLVSCWDDLKKEWEEWKKATKKE